MTTITGAAREPEIVDLQGFLRGMGAEVSGAGGSVIHRSWADGPSIRRSTG